MMNGKDKILIGITILQFCCVIAFSLQGINVILAYLFGVSGGINMYVLWERVKLNKSLAKS